MAGHVAQRQQVLALDNHASFAVHQVVWQSAQLGTLAPVGTASLEHLADGAPSAVAHAQRPVDKCLERHSGHAADGGNLVKCQFAGHDQLGESQCFKELCLFGRAQVTLRAGMQRDGRQVESQQTQVLDDKRIHADAVQVMHQPLHLHQFVVIDEGVDRGIDLGTEPVGVVAGAPHVVERVGRIGARTVMGCTHVHRIGTMVYGGDGDVGVAGRSQQFYEGRLGHG